VIIVPRTLIIDALGGALSKQMSAVIETSCVDPADIAAHQIARYAGLVLLMPWSAATVLRRVEG
jgi:hypothetical protein